MLIDSAEIPSDSCLEADVAVVGAGPAGIVVALELASAGRRVLLIDSGGNSRQPWTQQLGELAGQDPAHVSMSLATSRQIGGASNLWGGRCVPFDPIDFEPRAIVGESTWPVSYQELRPYFQRACDWCICGEAVFDACDVPSLAERSLVPGFPDGRVRASSLERWSLPTNFGREYRSALKDTPGLTLVTNLTCTEVVCDPEQSRVQHLRTQSLDGCSVKISASRYVLACGGLEVTRLLFASNRCHPEGLGNHSGHLGRWYMGHVESRIARVHFTTPPAETTLRSRARPRGCVRPPAADLLGGLPRQRAAAEHRHVAGQPRRRRPRARERHSVVCIPDARIAVGPVLRRRGDSPSAHQDHTARIQAHACLECPARPPLGCSLCPRVRLSALPQAWAKGPGVLRAERSQYLPAALPR